MDPRATVKVGIAVILGLAGLIAAWSFLAHEDWNTYPLQVRFEDSRGLQVQAPVRMSGVKIGEVKTIELDPKTRKPIVTLRIDNKYRQAIPEDSRIVITTGVLVTNPQVEVIPGKSAVAMRPGKVYAGAEPLSPLAQLSPETDRIIKQFEAAVKAMTPQLEQSMTHVEGILRNTEVMTADLAVVASRARRLASEPQIEQTLHSVLNDLDAVSSQARQMTETLSTEMKSFMTRNSGRVDDLLTRVLDLLQRFTDTADSARALVMRLAEQVNDPRLQESIQDTMDLARATMARFNQVASDIHTLLGDEEVQGNVKATLATVRETAESGKKVVADVSKVVGRINAPSASRRFGIGQPELTIDFGGRGDHPHFRSNVDVRLPIGKENAFHLGMYDFAESNKLTAQYETQIIGLGGLRYGLYASKLGLGLDFGLGPGVGMWLDAYDPNNLKVDSRVYFRLNRDFSLWVGVEGLFSDTTPTMGLRLHR